LKLIKSLALSAFYILKPELCVEYEILLHGAGFVNNNGKEEGAILVC